MNFQKLKQMIILTDNLSMNDVLVLVRRKVRQYVFSDEFEYNIDPNVSTPGYITIIFNIEGFRCKWSINQDGYICYHNLDCVSREFGKILDKEEEKKFCEKFYGKLLKERDNDEEIKIIESQIERLQGTLNELKSYNSNN